MSLTNVYPTGNNAGAPRIPPLLAFTSDVLARRAFCIMVPVNVTPDKSVPVRTAPEISAPVPIRYPPEAVTALTIKLYVAGNAAGGPTIDNPPLRTLSKRAFVKSAPSKSAPVTADPVKFAPLRSE